MDEAAVMAISATVGGPSTFAIARNSPDREHLVSSSLTIQNALLPALLSGAKLEQLDLVPETNVIKRVFAFALGIRPLTPFSGDYTISRIATQRSPNGTGEHLEAFLKKIGDNEEKAYNVYDPSLQSILIAAFRSIGPELLRVDVHFDGDEIVTVTLGERFRT